MRDSGTRCLFPTPALDHPLKSLIDSVHQGPAPSVSCGPASPRLRRARTKPTFIALASVSCTHVGRCDTSLGVKVDTAAAWLDYRLPQQGRLTPLLVYSLSRVLVYWWAPLVHGHALSQLLAYQRPVVDNQLHSSALRRCKPAHTSDSLFLPSSVLLHHTGCLLLCTGLLWRCYSQSFLLNLGSKLLQGHTLVQLRPGLRRHPLVWRATDVLGLAAIHNPAI